MASETMVEEMIALPRRGRTCRPYAPEEAKARFVLAASRLGPGRAIQMAPWKSVGLALSAGILLGYSRPLRRGLVRLGKLTLKGVIGVITHLRPSLLAEPGASTDTVESDAQPRTKRRQDR